MLLLVVDGEEDDDDDVAADAVADNEIATIEVRKQKT